MQQTEPRQLDFEFELVRVAVAAQMLDCAAITIRRWIASGRLQPVRLGRSVRLRRADLERVAREGFAM